MTHIFYIYIYRERERERERERAREREGEKDAWWEGEVTGTTLSIMKGGGGGGDSEELNALKVPRECPLLLLVKVG